MLHCINLHGMCVLSEHAGKDKGKENKDADWTMLGHFVFIFIEDHVPACHSALFGLSKALTEDEKGYNSYFVIIFKLEDLLD